MATATPRSDPRRRLTRRRLIAAAATVPMGLAAAGQGQAAPLETRSLRMANVNTGETFDGLYFNGEGYVWSALTDLDWLMRDHHVDASVPMDPRLFDILWRLSERYRRARGHMPTLAIHSGYRSPETNRALRSEGAALNSYHLRGQAVDLSVQGYGIHILANLSRDIGQGGWGIYWRGRFVHLDTGPARFWYRR